MIIIPKGKIQLNQFINLPQLIYQGDPNWIKPLIGIRAAEFRSSANPVLRYHDLELYLSLQNAEPAGRIAAFVDQQYNVIHREKAAFFGFFECFDNDASAGELFAAVDHFAATRGIQKIIGPVDFSTNYQAGLLINGYSRPTVMTPYHKKYYPRLVESNGYKKLIDLYAYTFSKEMPFPDRLERMAKVLKKRHPEISVQPLNQIKGLKIARILTNLYNQAFSGNWGWVPMTGEEFSYLLKTIASLEHTGLNYLAFSGHTPVGFLLTVPDLYASGQEPSVSGYLPKTTVFRKLRVTVLGVVPAYRKLGIEAELGVRVLRDAWQKGYEQLEFSVILENNAVMNNLVKREFGLPASKTFRIYEKQGSGQLLP